MGDTKPPLSLAGCDPLTDEALNNTDITGLGVLTAFVLTAFMTLVVVFWFYCKGWLSPTLYKEWDNVLLHRSPGADDGGPDRDTLLKEAIIPFVKAMADLHLGYGTAMLVATVLMMANVGGMGHEISVYTFQIATRLGYFSGTVHLSLLTICRDSHQHIPMLRRPRSVLMAIFLVCMFLSLLVTESVTFRFNRRIPVACAMSHWKLVDTDREGYESLSDEFIIYFNLAYLLLVMTWGYLSRLWHWTTTEKKVQSLDHLATVNRRCGRLKSGWRQGTVSSIAGDLWFIISRWLLHFEASHASELGYLLFYFTFGLVHLFKFLSEPDVHHKVQPAYGQLMPLFLVAIPVLNLLDCVDVVKRTRNSNTHKVTGTLTFPTGNSNNAPILRQGRHAVTGELTFKIDGASYSSTSPSHHYDVDGDFTFEPSASQLILTTPSTDSTAGLPTQETRRSSVASESPQPLDPISRKFVVLPAALYVAVVVLWILAYSGVIPGVFIISAILSILNLVRRTFTGFSSESQEEAAEQSGQSQTGQSQVGQAQAGQSANDIQLAEFRSSETGPLLS